jgi:hypothetical protein
MWWIFVAGLIVYFFMGLHEFRTGNPKSGRLSWLQGLLVISGLVAFAGSSSHAIARVTVGLAVACVGTWFINKYYRRSRDKDASSGRKQDGD